MKAEIITCDFCNRLMYEENDKKSGASFHFQKPLAPKMIEVVRKWWWRGNESNTDKYDICGNCYRTIQSFSFDKGFKQIYQIYRAMCIADQETFIKELLKLAKENDRYYDNHKNSINN